MRQSDGDPVPVDPRGGRQLGGRLRKSVVSDLAAGFLRAQAKLRSQRAAVPCHDLARHAAALAELLHVALILLGRAGTQLVVDMQRVKPEPQLGLLRGQAAEYIKKAHRIRASGKADDDVHVLSEQIVFFYRLQRLF